MNSRGGGVVGIDAEGSSLALEATLACVLTGNPDMTDQALRQYELGLRPAGTPPLTM